MTQARYEIRIGGDLSPQALSALAGLQIAIGVTYTTVTGTFDQSGLYGLITRIESLGLELIDIRRVRTPRRPSGE